MDKLPKFAILHHLQTPNSNISNQPWDGKNTGSWAFPHHQKKSNGMKPATSTEKPAALQPALRSFLKFANGIAGKFQWDQGSCSEATGKGTARNSKKDQQQIGRNGETRALHAPVMLKKTTSIFVNRCVIHYVFIFDITSGVQSSCTNEAPIIDPLSLIELWYSKQTGAAQRLLSCSFHVHVTHRSYPSTSPNPQFLWGRTLANPVLVQLMS